MNIDTTGKFELREQTNLLAHPHVGLWLLIGCGVLIGIFLLSRENFLLSHALLEIFSISVAGAVFMFVWNARRLLDNDALVLLGIAYFFISLIDLLHTLSYTGPNLFPDHNAANLAAQLWIGARSLESFSVFVFAVFLGRRINLHLVTIAYATATAAFLSTLFGWQTFPTCYIEGQGETLFKQGSGILISGLLLAAGRLLWSRRNTLPGKATRLLLCSLLFLIFSALCSGFEGNGHGLTNLAHHFCKFLSVIFVYLTLMEMGLARPYQFLVHKQSETGRQLREATERWQAYFDRFPGMLSMFDGSGRCLMANRPICEVFGRSEQEIIGRHFRELLPGKTADAFNERLMLLKRSGQLMTVEDDITGADNVRRTYQTILFPFHDNDKTVYGGISQDITERRQAERTTAYEQAQAEASLRLKEASPVLSSPELIQQAIAEFQQLTASPIGFFHIISEDDRLILEQNWANSTPAQTTRGLTSIAGGVWADCLAKRQAVINNGDAPLTMPDGILPATRQLVVPVFAGKRIAALAGVANRTSAYTENDSSAIATITELTWNIICRNRAEDAIAESQRILTTLVANLPGIAFRCRNDSQWTMEYLSEGVTTMLGYTPGELLGNNTLSFADLIDHDDRQMVWDAVQTALTAKVPYEIEYRVWTKDGKQLVVWERGTGIWNKTGMLQAIEGFIRNITSRKRNETKLRRLSSVVEQVSEAIFITSTSGEIRYVNPAFEIMTGFSKEEALGQNPRILRSDTHDPDFYRELWDCIKSGKNWKGRIVNRKKDGTLFTTESTISPIFSTSEEIVSFVAITNDITDELKREEKLNHAQKMEAIGTLAGGIAHDFNNILSPIIGYAEMLREDLRYNSDLSNFVTQILQASGRAKDLVNQILAISRHREKDLKPISLQPIIKEITKFIKASLPSTITIEADIMDECGQVLADATQIYQVLMNLTTNAYHAMEERGGFLRISLCPATMTDAMASQLDIAPGSYLRITVTDTGHGIESANLNHIFEPYFTTKGEGKGTGLGLSMVHGIVRKYEGAVKVESVVNQGTAFTIYLPVTRSSQQCEEKQPPADPGLLAKGHVLLIDDEEPIVAMMDRKLQRLGYRVTACTSSRNALALLMTGESAYDLVFTDMTMPELTGIQLAAEIRRLNESMPIVICTGSGDKFSEEKLKSAGINRILHKPVSHQELIAALGSLLQS